MSDKVAILGAGLVGSAWAIVFARAGHAVSLYDGDGAQSRQALARVGDNMRELVGFGLLDDADAALARISIAGNLAEALDGAAYAQESVFERADVKTEFYAEIDKVAGADLIVGSSSSGIPASVFTEGLDCAARCLIAHPINPPYVIPLVEVVPAPWTADAAVQTCWDLMLDVDMAPVRLTREVDGFIANRLQAALLWEAFRLLEAGIATAEDIDKTISEGLGRRWTFIGPFETIDLNAPGGLQDYAARLGPGFFEFVKQGEPAEPWSEAVIAKAHGERRNKLPLREQPARQAWRDRRLMALAKHFQEEAK
ncbi:MAG: L-carnitine dehydrogenase [Alphaproteobacteria bacterium MarineAlpha10_Bin2]|nr:MAG: L-carnitine dehydrogenase [Alphaproteobacteria bacterium MarineAlpha10_Bin2]